MPLTLSIRLVALIYAYSYRYQWLVILFPTFFHPSPSSYFYRLRWSWPGCQLPVRRIQEPVHLPEGELKKPARRRRSDGGKRTRANHNNNNNKNNNNNNKNKNETSAIDGLSLINLFLTIGPSFRTICEDIILSATQAQNIELLPLQYRRQSPNRVVIDGYYMLKRGPVPFLGFDLFWNIPERI